MSKAINHLKKETDFSKSVSTKAFKKEARAIFRSKIQYETKKRGFEKASRKVSDILSQLDIWKKGLIVASYYALPGEISPLMFQRKHQRRLSFVFPQVKGTSGKMQFVSAVWDKDKDWEKSSWGGRQPSGREAVSVSEIDVFFVPALAFDREGRRLGRGKGFYDHALSQAGGLKIGLAGAFQISNTDLPEEKHDIRMDAVSTDRFLYMPSNRFQKFMPVWFEFGDFTVRRHTRGQEDKATEK